MEKGKFEAPKGQKSPSRQGNSRQTAGSRKSDVMSKLWPVLAAVAGVLVLVVGILIATKNKPKPPAETHTTHATMELTGMPRAEVERRFSELDLTVKKTLVLTLEPELVEGELPKRETPDGEAEDTQTVEEPLVLELSDAISSVHLDMVKLDADLNEGRGREGDETVDSFVLDPRDYLVFDEENLRAKIDEFVEEYGSEFAEASISVEPVETEAPAEGEESEENAVPDQKLTIKNGSIGRALDADKIYETVTEAYALALIAEDPETVFQPHLSYELRIPAPVDVEALWTRYCKEPVEPEIDTSTGEVTDGKDGYGFDREALEALLAAAASGEEIEVTLSVIKPETDADTLRDSLFRDVLGEAHTTHTAIYNRTNNLKLACAAIDGTIVMPGEEFSFNKVVGQRTAEKGYKEAIAYVAGGESKPELGGGVCQVASSIYYATLQADLKTTERAAHMYMVDYVPYGMDATVYWGSLDYKFENNSPYPIKIAASVSDGKVHIILYGTEWKDYTVTLDYKILEKTPWETVEREVPNDGTYHNGEVITTPYTGYKVETYKTTRNNTTGAEETTRIASSTYKKRDKVIAKIVEEPTEPKPTEPKPTEPQPTEPKPTEPKPTEPKPTEPKPTDPEPTDPEPTDPDPTDPEPTDPEPTDPEPTDPEPSEDDEG